MQTLRVMVGVVALLGACSDDDEDNMNANGGSCSPASDTCSGETICVNISGANKCVAAFPRTYAITAIKVVLPTNNQGTDWDVGGGAPDPYVKVSVNNVPEPATPAVQDVFTAQFAGPINVAINAANSTLVVDVFDEDAAVDDHAFTCTGTFTAELARARALGCGTTVAYTIAPK